MLCTDYRLQLLRLTEEELGQKKLAVETVVCFPKLLGGPKKCLFCCAGRGLMFHAAAFVLAGFTTDRMRSVSKKKRALARLRTGQDVVLADAGGFTLFI